MKSFGLFLFLVMLLINLNLSIPSESTSEDEEELFKIKKNKKALLQSSKKAKKEKSNIQELEFIASSDSFATVSLEKKKTSKKKTEKEFYSYTSSYSHKVQLHLLRELFDSNKSEMFIENEQEKCHELEEKLISITKELKIVNKENYKKFREEKNNLRNTRKKVDEILNEINKSEFWEHLFMKIELEYFNKFLHLFKCFLRVKKIMKNIYVKTLPLDQNVILNNNPEIYALTQKYDMLTCLNKKENPMCFIHDEEMKCKALEVHTRNYKYRMKKQKNVKYYSMNQKTETFLFKEMPIIKNDILQWENSEEKENYFYKQCIDNYVRRLQSCLEKLETNVDEIKKIEEEMNKKSFPFFEKVKEKNILEKPKTHKKRSQKKSKENVFVEDSEQHIKKPQEQTDIRREKIPFELQTEDKEKEKSELETVESEKILPTIKSSNVHHENTLCSFDLLLHKMENLSSEPLIDIKKRKRSEEHEGKVDSSFQSKKLRLGEEEEKNSHEQFILKETEEYNKAAVESRFFILKALFGEDEPDYAYLLSLEQQMQSENERLIEINERLKNLLGFNFHLLNLYELLSKIQHELYSLEQLSLKEKSLILDEEEEINFIKENEIVLMLQQNSLENKILTTWNLFNELVFETTIITSSRIKKYIIKNKIVLNKKTIISKTSLNKKIVEFDDLFTPKSI